MSEMIKAIEQLVGSPCNIRLFTNCGVARLS